MRSLSRFAVVATSAFGAWSSASAQAPHPPVGVPADAVPFHGRWYRAYFEKVNWHTARDKCVRRGGLLAVVPDGATHEFIKDLAAGAVVWLGATDEKVEGRWIWVDGTEMRFTAWDQGEPNNAQGKEHYLQLIHNGTWNDVRYDPHEPVAGYICEWRPKP